jgi:mono/diheme cytochrome c family protein
MSFAQVSSFVVAAFITALGAPWLGAANLDLTKLPPAVTRPVDFVKDIEPLLAAHCYKCHGEQRSEADLRWDLKESAMKGSDHGPVILVGKSAESRMIQLVAGIDAQQVMPKKGERLSAEQVGLLRAWIDQGANWPEPSLVKKSPKTEHWAFKAPVRPRVPVISNQ